MATAAPPESARSHYLISALLAQRAASNARRAAKRGVAAAARVLVQHQAAGAVLAERAVADMLAEQGLSLPPDARLNPLSFTTDARAFELMAKDAVDFDRLVESLVQDATRAAESVSVAVRDEVGWVRQLNLPSCSRCVALAGRLYRYSDGFMRHPGDDCTTIAVHKDDARLVVADPVELVRQGQVHGLSQADTQALNEGADFGQVVNVRRKAAGLRESGRVLARAGRPTPEGIYRLSSDRTQAVELLGRYGYIT